MNTYKTIIIILILNKLSSSCKFFQIEKKKLCELTSNQNLNSTKQIMGINYFKTEKFYFLRDENYSTLYNYQTFCKDNKLDENYFILKEEKDDSNPIHKKKECQKNFDFENNKKIELKIFDDFDEILNYKNSYELLSYFDENKKSIKNVNNNKINNYVITKVKNLKYFLEDLEIFYKNKNINYELECIKKINYDSFTKDNINFYQPISFKIYLNFHKMKLYYASEIKIELKKDVNFYHRFMNGVLTSIFKLENDKLFIRRNQKFIFSETEILFFNFSKKKIMATFSINEIFANFIYKFLEKDQRRCIKDLFFLLQRCYNYFSKNHILFFLDFISYWYEFKELFYEIIINDEIDSTKIMMKFNKFLLQFKDEVYHKDKKVVEEKQKTNFVIDEEFAVKNILEESSDEDEIDEKSLIVKLFGYHSEAFSFIFEVFFLINIFILF